MRAEGAGTRSSLGLEPALVGCVVNQSSLFPERPPHFSRVTPLAQRGGALFGDANLARKMSWRLVSKAGPILPDQSGAASLRASSNRNGLGQFARWMIHAGWRSLGEVGQYHWVLKLEPALFVNVAAGHRLGWWGPDVGLSAAGDDEACVPGDAGAEGAAECMRAIPGRASASAGGSSGRLVGSDARGSDAAEQVRAVGADKAFPSYRTTKSHHTS